MADVPPYDFDAMLTGRGVSSTLLASGNESATLFYDNFSGPDAIANGRTPVSGPNAWSVTGAGAADQTKVRAGGGKFYTLTGAVGNVYLQMITASTPWETSGLFEITDATASSVVIAVIKDLPGHGLSAMWHANLTFGANGVNSNITPGYWNDVWNGSGSTVTNVAPAFFMSSGNTNLAINTVYRFRLVFNAPFVDYYVENVATGDVAMTARTYEPLTAAVIGPAVFFEITNTSTVWHEALARAKPTTNSLTYDRKPAGIEGSPIGMKFPASANFMSAYVGTPLLAPKGVFSVRYDGTASAAPGFYSTGQSNLIVASETPGNIAKLTIVAGNGATGTVGMGSASDMLFTGASGTTFLTKPAGVGTPYFAANAGVGGSAGPLLSTGTGVPVAASPNGSIFLRTDGAAGSTFYVREAGAWVAK